MPYFSIQIFSQICFDIRVTDSYLPLVEWMEAHSHFINRLQLVPESTLAVSGFAEVVKAVDVHCFFMAQAVLTNVLY